MSLVSQFENHAIGRIEAALSAPTLDPNRSGFWEHALADELPSTVMRTFKFRLLPRKGQHRRLVEALDHTRDLYNAALEERIGAYQKAKRSISWVDQFKELTELRGEEGFRDFPVSMQRWPLKKLDLAFAAFFSRLKKGEKPGFPRFKGRYWFKSFGFADADGWKVDGNRLYMKGVGRVRLHIHRTLPSAPIACQIKRDGKGWVALLVCAIPIEAFAPTGRQVGIDLGITSFIATSGGEVIPGLKAGRRAQKEIRRRQRALARCRRGSNNRKKAKAIVARLYERAANARRTFQHQVAAKLVRENDLIAIEDLNFKGLARSMLARDINDAGWASFTNLLIEKAEKAARTVVKVDPRYTSQACSGCGVIVPKKLSQRVHRCDCGTVLDRDHNAAINILNRAVVRPDLAKSLTKAA